MPDYSYPNCFPYPGYETPSYGKQLRYPAFLKTIRIRYVGLRL